MRRDSMQQQRNVRVRRKRTRVRMSMYSWIYRSSLRVSRFELRLLVSALFYIHSELAAFNRLKIGYRQIDTMIYILLCRINSLWFHIIFIWTVAVNLIFTFLPVLMSVPFVTVFHCLLLLFLTLVLNFMNMNTVQDSIENVKLDVNRQKTKLDDWHSIEMQTRSPSICFALCDPVTLTFDFVN